MSAANLPGCGDNTPALGAEVETACGGRVRCTPDTPCALFRGETVFFCLPVCKDDFERDPLTSCLAGKLLSQR